MYFVVYISAGVWDLVSTVAVTSPEYTGTLPSPPRPVGLVLPPTHPVNH